MLVYLKRSLIASLSPPVQDFICHQVSLALGNLECSHKFSLYFCIENYPLGDVWDFLVIRLRQYTLRTAPLEKHSVCLFLSSDVKFDHSVKVLPIFFRIHLSVFLLLTSYQYVGKTLKNHVNILLSAKPPPGFSICWWFFYDPCLPWLLQNNDSKC